MSTPPEPDRAAAPEAGPQSAAGPQSPNQPPSPSPPQSAVAPVAGPPQSPSAPQRPAGPQSPPGPQAPAGVQSPATGGYTGPIPPGGWQLPATPATGALADWGSRLAATLLDAVMWLVVTFVLGILVTVAFGFGTIVTGSEGVAAAGAVVNFLIGFALYAAYTGLLMARSGASNGQTLGKQLLGARAVRRDGTPVTLGTVAVRHWLMKYIVFGYVPLFVWYGFTLSNAAGVGALVMALLYLVTLLNYLWPLWDKENRAFHDMAASTRVVRA